jgi:putative ABC transport system permease protein
MLSPRWRKVVRDLWGNKLRTVLVVLSIAVGVFAVGMIAGARETVITGLDDSWNSTDPPNLTLYTDLFDEDLLQTVRRVPGVRDVDARRSTGVRFQMGIPAGPAVGGRQAFEPPDESKWRNLSLYAYPDYGAIHVYKVFPVSGAWPPPERQVLIEGASMAWMGAKPGDTVLVKAADGRLRELKVAGIVHDPAEMQASWNGTGTGYVDRDTLDWLGLSRNFSQIHVISTTPNPGQSEMKALAQELRNNVEKSGITVGFTYIYPPGKHPARETIEPMLMLLGVLGFLALILGGLLVVNTMQALLTQQVRQMGIMKAIGAANGQVMGIYLGMAGIFGLLALIVAVPLGALGAQGLTQFIANLLNFEVSGISIPPQVLAMEIAIGLAVPLLAALYPVITASRITAREAMSDYGLASAARPSRSARRRREGLGVLARGFSRPTLLSLRNTFRRKGRLALTLATLILGGAIFVGVFSVRDSLLGTLDNMFQYVDYDAVIGFERDYRIDKLEAEALTVPGVVAAEGWRFDAGRRMRPDKTEGDSLQLRGIPARSALIRPSVVEGRWLLPDDGNAIVVNTMFLKDEPDIKVGSDLKLKIGTKETDWKVVGIVAGTPPAPLLHANYPYLARLMGAPGRAGVVVTVTRPRDPVSQETTARALEEHFKSVGMKVANRQTSADERTRIVAQFNVLIMLLLIMAVLLAVVGGIGLTGTMSLNVLERTREIGVMRAIGASDGSIFQIVVVEGLLIGLMSWLCAAALAFPLGKLLSDAIGSITFRDTLDYVYSTSGLAIWLVTATVLAVLASLLPARRASRVSVRDVLAYE